MKSVEITSQFKRDLKRVRKRSKPLDKLYAIVEKLAQDIPLESRYRPHKLSGNYATKWECHIEPDWLLIYEITKDSVLLHRTGSHTDLFDM